MSNPLKALKNVYTLGHVSRFERKLEKRIKSQEKDIEQMCSIHYHKFVESLNDISAIEGDATKLIKKGRFRDFCQDNLISQKLPVWHHIL